MLLLEFSTTPVLRKRHCYIYSLYRRCYRKVRSAILYRRSQPVDVHRIHCIAPGCMAAEVAAENLGHSLYPQNVVIGNVDHPIAVHPSPFEVAGNPLT